MLRRCRRGLRGRGETEGKLDAQKRETEARGRFSVLAGVSIVQVWGVCTTSCLQQEEVETNTAQCVEIQGNNAVLGTGDWRDYRQECWARLLRL